jgi:tetratricopeptide (TPR) repeat protein
MDWTQNLDSRHSGAVLQLTSLLEEGDRFCFILVQFNDDAYRDLVIAELASHYPEQAIVSVTANQDLLATLQQTAQSASVIHLIDTTESRSDQAAFYALLQRLNQRREWLAEHVNRGMVLWLSSAQISAFARHAPDLWAWRKAVVNFCNSVEDKPGLPIYADRIDEDNSGYTDKRQRLSEIDDYLAGKTAYSLADAALFREKYRILQSIGELDAAVVAARQGLSICWEHNDKRAAAISYGDLADVLQARGELDEALRIRREEELPVYEALGDKRLIAVTMGQIADVLQARGDLDEALRIRREEELPVYEALGDKRSIAVTMGEIADVLQARGDLDEALRIRREEQLPVYEALGDKRLRAVAMGKVADVLQTRGDLDEALRIRCEEELPVYEALGDKRSRAVTMGKIAGVLQVRGDLDEALRIRREEELPVFEALGDKRELLVGRTNMALLLQRKNPELHAKEIRQLLSLALNSAELLGLPEQDIIRKILQPASPE